MEAFSGEFPKHLPDKESPDYPSNIAKAITDVRRNFAATLSTLTETGLLTSDLNVSLYKALSLKVAKLQGKLEAAKTQEEAVYDTNPLWLIQRVMRAAAVSRNYSLGNKTVAIDALNDVMDLRYATQTLRNFGDPLAASTGIFRRRPKYRS